MKTKSMCLVCRGSRKKTVDGVEHDCLGCNGLGWVLVNEVAMKRPEANFEVEVEELPKQKSEKLPVDASFPSAPENRKTLHIRAGREGLLDRIFATIEEYQREYLQTLDIMKLRPMILLDIAKIVGCDVATISIYLRNKMINGIRVKELFSEAVFGVSNKAIQHMIKNIVEKEAAPYSDTELVRQLQAQGITLSRRTVTKYRHKLNIPDKNERKKNGSNLAGK